MTLIPGYWMNETGPVLQPAVRAYLNRQPLTTAQIAAIRGYLRQWIDAPVWHGPAIDQLRRAIDGLDTRQAIDKWLVRAREAEIDPL